MSSPSSSPLSHHPVRSSPIKRKRSVSSRLDSSPSSPTRSLISSNTHRRCSSSAVQQPPRTTVHHHPIRSFASTPFPSFSSSPVPVTHSSHSSLPKSLSSPLTHKTGTITSTTTTTADISSPTTTTNSTLISHHTPTRPASSNHSSYTPSFPRLQTHSRSSSHSQPRASSSSPYPSPYPSPCPSPSPSPSPSPTAASSTPSPISQDRRSPEPSPSSFRFPQTPKRPRRSSIGLLNDLSLSSPSHPSQLASHPTTPTQHAQSRLGGEGRRERRGVRVGRGILGAGGGGAGGAGVGGGKSEFLGPSPDNEFLPSWKRRSQYLIDHPHDVAQLGCSRYQEDYECLALLHGEKGRGLGGEGEEGGRGVYLVCQRITGVRYAIKKIPKQSSWKTLSCPYIHDYSLSVFREARALATFSHPNIVRYHNSFIEGNHLYLQLEYCSGGSLEGLVCQKGTPFSVKKIIGLVRQLSSALVYLSNRQPRLVHCNLTPSNILCVPPPFSSPSSSSPISRGERERGGGGKRREEMVFKLCDFGAVRAEEGDVDMLLDEGLEMGASEYLPAHLDAITPAVDIYSLGLVAFEVACEGRVAKEALREADHRRELQVNKFSVAFQNLILRMVHVDSFERPGALELSRLETDQF